MDNDYDLGDVDTTAKVMVKNLTIPLNVDNIKLDKILDIEDDSQIKKIIDPITGNTIYAVLEEGTFESDEIDIPAFTTEKPNIDPITSTLDIEKLNKELDTKLEEEINSIIAERLEEFKDFKDTPQYKDAEKKAKEYVEEHRKEIEKQVFETTAKPGEDLASYDIKSDPTTVKAESYAVNKSVQSIDNIDVEANFKVNINLSNLTGIIDNIEAKNFKIQMPKGLTIVNIKTSNGSEPTYDSLTGILDFSKSKIVPAIKNGKFDFEFSITNVAKTESITLTPGNNKDGHFVLNDEISVLDGTVFIQKENFVNGHTFFDLPDAADFTCTPQMSSIKVKNFTGDIKYDVDGVDIDPIELNDIPDVLADEGTNIFLDNPQIYISFENPLSNHHLYATTNLSLTGEKSGVKRNPLTMDNDLKAESSINEYCISPQDPGKYYTGYESASWKQFSTLGEVISGNGIPDKIHVEIVEPSVPLQEVTKFELGQKIGSVKGSYTFYAPLKLANKGEGADKQETIIVYNETMDGWSDENLEKLTITGLKLNIKSLDSTIPIGADLTIKPLDANGNVIKGVEFSSAHINPNAKNQEVEIHLVKGEINNLDGISFSAYIKTDGSNPLAPTQYIKLGDLKVTVDGYYEDEL